MTIVINIIRLKDRIAPPDGSTFLLLEDCFGDGMQLLYVECPMRLDQRQLTLSKDINLFKIQLGVAIPIMCFSLKGVPI